MKNLLFIIMVLVAATVRQEAIGQEKLKEAKLTFEISYPDADEMDDRVLAMMPKESTVYIKNGNSRWESKGAFGSNISIFNGSTKESIVLMDMMGKKSAIKSTAEEMEEESKKTNGEYEVKITDETKKIAGYICKKAIITFKDEDKEPVEVWFTNEIEGSNSGRSLYKGINGFMMEFLVTQKSNMGKMVMKMTCSKVEKVPVSDDLFKVPDGYTVMTKEEMMKQYSR